MPKLSKPRTRLSTKGDRMIKSKRDRKIKEKVQSIKAVDEPEAFNIAFDIQEIEALLSLIDIAIKSEGLNIAQNGVILSSKIQEAIQEAQNDIVLV